VPKSPGEQLKVQVGTYDLNCYCGMAVGKTLMKNKTTLNQHEVKLHIGMINSHNLK